MENSLYLLEIFVEKIGLAPGCTDDLAADVVITAEVGSGIKMEVECLNRPLTDYANNNSLTMNCGKSILFSETPEKLKKLLLANPLKLTFLLAHKKRGSTTIKWDDQIYENVANQSSGKKKSIEPFSKKDTYTLTENGKEIVYATVLYKLAVFGSKLQTSFQLLETTGQAHNKYLIKGGQGPTTFQFQKQDETRSSRNEMMPLLPFVGSIYMKSAENMTINTANPDMSFMALFNTDFDIKQSFPNTASTATFDIVSLIGRPEENKFIDLRIRGGSQGVIFEFDHFENDNRNHSENSAKQSTPSKTISEIIEIEDDLTSERINKLLCKNKDCPAAKKFAELGLGPLAKEKRLGSAYLESAPYCTYGLSQTYGVYDNYGPYGLFSRPKRPEQPFIPKKDEDANWNDNCWKPKRVKKTDSKTENIDCCSPLRLTGGGIFDYNDIKSPLHDCQELMNQYDEVLAKYKNALGPCGMVTCPFSPNVVTESCKIRCNYPPDYKPEPEPCLAPSQQQNCDNPKECPAMKKTRLPIGACGNPKCAYAQFKTQLPNEDAIMELQFLPPALNGKCGQPQCPYNLEPDLPPIHWDCPDPLPEGTCKNPNCPFLPPDLKCLNQVCPPPNPLCGNLNCPFALPPSCVSPNCPFNSKECPYATPKQEPNQSEMDSLCDNPDCPYAETITEEASTSLCGNPECPYVIAEQEKESCCQASAPQPQQQQTCQSSTVPPCLQPTDPCSYIAALLQYIFKAYNLCPNNSCPYPMKDMLNICLGGAECPLMKKKEESVVKEQQQPCDACNVEEEDTKKEEKRDSCCKSNSFDIEDNPIVVTTGTREDDFDNAPCTPATCAAGLCEDCCQSKSETGTKTKKNQNGEKKSQSDPGIGAGDNQNKKKKKKKRSKYVYSIGDKYPGIQIGHKECVMPGFNVPPKMGWLWNIHTPCMQLKPRRGWRPGAIGRTMAAIIQKHHEAKGLKTLELKSLRTKKYGYSESYTELNIKPKPTLQIKKKDGCYWITMNPLKDPNTLVENENPYMDCTPMQFKIVKNKEPKPIIKTEDSEYRSCFCGEEENDENEQEQEESSSDSELDIEFTPPAGLIHPERFRRKRNVVHCDTQYMTSDFEQPKTKDDKKGKKGKKGKKDKKGKKGKGGKGGKKGKKK